MVEWKIFNGKMFSETHPQQTPLYAALGFELRGSPIGQSAYTQLWLGFGNGGLRGSNFDGLKANTPEMTFENVGSNVELWGGEGKRQRPTLNEAFLNDPPGERGSGLQW